LLCRQTVLLKAGISSFSIDVTVAAVLFDLDRTLLDRDSALVAYARWAQSLQRVVERARQQSIRHVVLRVKRLRNPDAVCLEKLEHFLSDAKEKGLDIFLAGVRGDMERPLKRLEASGALAADRLFVERDDIDSATLQAVRTAYRVLGEDNRCVHCNDRAQEQTTAAAYYLA
jgi:SulP family sulfate permease